MKMKSHFTLRFSAPSLGAWVGATDPLLKALDGPCSLSVSWRSRLGSGHASLPQHLH